MVRKGLGFFSRKKSFGRHHHSEHLHAAADGASSSSSSEEVARMEERVARAEAIIVKWDPDTSAYAKITSLFYEDRVEARRFLAEVCGLQRAMLAFVSGVDSARLSHRCLVRAQTLMQAAMRRLEKEFYQMLAANRDLLDPESVSVRSARSSVSEESGYDPSECSPEDEALAAGKFITEVERAAGVVMADLQAIADTMVFAGYGKECIRTYRILRRSIVDEGLYRLGFERLSPAQIQKLEWPVLELKVRSWLGACRVAVRTLFHGERVLTDHVFAGSASVREAVFAHIAGEVAVQFLAFAESMARSKRSPEKLFRLLDMYDAITELWPDIQLVFSFESTTVVREQALASFSKLAEAVRATLADFESAILKESSRAPVPGGGVHPMTRYAMNYISLLADYQPALTEIFAEFPFHPPTPKPAVFFGPPEATPSRPSASGTSSPLADAASSNEESNRSAIASRFAWVIFVLLCKLDGKAEAHRDAALSNLFLANNLQYIVNKVRSCGLLELLGEEWAARHAAKARQYASGYEKLAWGRVAAAVPAGGVSAEEARERMQTFRAVLEEAFAAQADWVVADARMREEVRAMVRDMVVPAYRGFYSRWRAALGESAAARFSPDEVAKRLGEELFSQISGSDGSGNLVRVRPGP
ncbi:hypothetical protein Cni_G15638 [Canna indica]|uniref:Exocyst subunit Exo70 family protein n=1 Tax=Canna indica TaxID=4628 RepID=A0AAQ3KDZ9_9LILI|nr:hypothetical protein Cni_G15638 [Canna indica]